MNRRKFESLAGGAATVAALTTVAVVVAIILGRPRSIPFVLLAVVLVATSAWFGTRRLEPAMFRWGAILSGVVVLSAEVISESSGLGLVQIAGTVSAVAVAVVGPRILEPLRNPLSPGLVVFGVGLLSFSLFRVVVGGGGFGHDEAAYVLKARQWLEGTPGTGWDVHRGIGHSVLASALLPFTSAESVYRAVSVTLTLGTVAAVGWLGRTVRSNRVGLLAAAVFAVSPTLLRRGAEYLTDVPSTGLALVATALIWRWCRGGGAWTLRLAGIIGALAFYVRYQVVLSLGLVALVASVLYRDRVRSSVRQVMETAGISLALLVPHFVWATLLTGVPWGVITETGEAGGRAYLGEGLVDYARDFPDLLAGQAGAVAILAALVWAGVQVIGSVRDRRLGDEARMAVFLVAPALGQFVALGLIAHGEPRFVFFPVALLAVAGAVGVDRLRRLLPPWSYRVSVAAVSMALVGGLAISVDRMDANAEARAQSTEVLVNVAETVRAESAGECSIVTTYGPQLTWYSGCHSWTYNQFRRNPGRPGEDFLVFFENGKRQPTGDELAELMATVVGDPITVADDAKAIGDATIWRVAG